MFPKAAIPLHAFAVYKLVPHNSARRLLIQIAINKALSLS